MKKNKELAFNALDSIRKNPRHWCQSVWHCGFTHGFAGFVELSVRGLPLDTPEATTLTSPEFDPQERDRLFKEFNLAPIDRSASTLVFAQHALGISRSEASLLFQHSHTVSELTFHIERIFSND